MTVNHMIKPVHDIQLAMIEGTDVEALCGHRFTPSVVVGTGGKADVPGARICERCDIIAELWEEMNELADRINELRSEERDLRALWAPSEIREPVEVAA